MQHLINYYSIFKLVQFFIKNGKKNLSLKIILKVFKRLKFHFNEKQIPILRVINIIFDNIRPILYYTKIKKSRKIFYLPELVKSEREINISLYWFKKAISKRKELKLEDRIFYEFIDIFSKKGETFNQKQKMYDLILINRPFLYLLKYK